MRGGIFASLGAESEVDDGPAPLDPALLSTLKRYLPGYLEEELGEERPRRGVLVNVLHHLNSVEHLLSPYLPRHLVQALKRRPVPGWVAGERLHGSLLFADVSGFTALSERLSRQGQEGIEQLTTVLNRYFESMLDILARSDGTLLKFAGDALWAYFPEQRRERQAEWAVRAALRMHRAVETFSAAALPLEMKIGVATGELFAMRVGSPRRMEYVVLGEAVVRTMAAEGQAVAGQVILDGATAAVLPAGLCTALPSGFHAIEHFPEVDEFEICAVQQRRRSSTAFLMASHTEIVAEIAQRLRQVEVLASYLPDVLVRRLLAGGGGDLESENRPTTVLFANVWGFKELLEEGVDLQRVTEMLSDYFRAVDEIVGEYEGVVARIDPYNRGSKMLVLFGALVTHEDDPERAIRSGLALEQRLRALNARWQRTHAGACVEQRMGITQGRTFGGAVGSSLRREYTVMGDDVNLAARLMGAAEPGQILIAREVEEDLGGRFRTSALPPIPVKGKAGLIPVYQVDGFRGSYLAGRLDRRGPLVGREVELERLRGLLHDVRSGSGQFLVLEGAAGVGKSHFVDALAQVALEEGFEPWLSACTSYGAGMPYGPWLDLVRSLAEMEPGTPPEARGEQLRRRLEQLELLEGSVALALFRLLGLQEYAPPVNLRRLSPEAVAAPAQPRAGPGLFQRLGQRANAETFATGAGGAPTLWSLARERQVERPAGSWKRLQERVASREQERLYEALVTLLKRLTESAPGLLVFENAQWMDAQSRALLRHLTGQLRDLPLLVVVVRRPGEGGSAEEGAYGGEVVQLSPLDREATGALLARLLEAPPSEELLEVVHSRSEGNPLFVEELARWLKGAGEEALLDPLEAFRASNTLQELVMSRLDALPHLEQSAVRGAAVVGLTFTLAELVPLLEDTRAALLPSAAHNLVAAGFALEEAPEAARYAFRQTLMREIVYDSQPYARRRELHARLAAYLEERPGGDPAAEAELLAHHYRLAHRWLPAARYLLVCGRKARQRYAYDRALSYFEEALQALAHLPVGEDAAEIRAQLHEGVGDVALLRGDLARAAAAYREARALLEDRGADAGARLLRKQALVLPVEGRADEAGVAARLAWERRAPEDAGGTAALRAWLLWRAGDAESEAWVSRAQALVAGRRDEWAAGVRVLLAELAGEEDAARRDYLALERRPGAALLDCRRGDRHFEEGDLAAALALYERAGELWEQEEDAQGLALARYCQARVRMEQGARSQALALLEGTLSLLEGAGSTVLEERERVHELLEQLRAGQDVSWPPMGRQRYDDAFRISLLFDSEELQTA